MTDAGVPAAGSSEAALNALTAALEQAKAAEQQHQKAFSTQPTPPRGAPPEATVFGLTMGALFMGLVLSSIGIGFLVYAKSEAQPLFALFGLALFAVPFVLTTTVPLAVAGVVLVALPILAKRYLNW